MMRLVSNTAENTIALGEKLGHAVRQGISIALTGDLGAGKTTFVQGLARGLGVPEHYYITSPTFTIINTYPADPLTLCHLDLYRLADADELEYIGFDDLLNPGHIIVVEWPDLLKQVSHPFDLEIDFQFDEAHNRILSIIACGQEGSNLLSTLSGP
jgi:tRNA threonylcarbamoyladenosine biosynthesis protein TsaE